MKNIYRAYFYAYPSKFGKVQNIQEKLLIDLSKNEGQGLAFRRGVDFDFLDDEKLHIIINSNLALTIRVEYKTFDSYNEAEETQYLSLKNGVNEFTLSIPKLNNSPLKEICIAVLSADNSKQKGYLKVKKFELT